MIARKYRGIPQVACVTRPVPHQVKAMAAISAALRNEGLVVRETYDRIPPEAVAFCWSFKWAKEIWAKHADSVICVLDHGLFPPRNKTTVTGWMGLNGLGQHPIVDDGGARLRKMGWDAKIHPPREGGKTALILGQCYNDVQILDHLEDYGSWLQERARELADEGWQVKFRPHPVQRRNDLGRYPNVAGITAGVTLLEDLDQYDVGCVVGFNSNALLEATFYGVRDVRLYHGGSMLYPISIQHRDGYRRVDFEAREALAARLAFCQWLPEEIASGEWACYHVPLMVELVNNGGKHHPWHSWRL